MQQCEGAGVSSARGDPLLQQIIVRNLVNSSAFALTNYVITAISQKDSEEIVII